MEKYLVIETDGINEEVNVFEDQEKACENAETIWLHLSSVDQKKNRVFVALVKQEYLEDEEDWNSYNRYDDGGFDSDNYSEIKACKKAIDEAGINFTWTFMNSMIESDELTINTARNGRNVAWIVCEAGNAAVYVDTLEALAEGEIEKELE